MRLFVDQLTNLDFSYLDAERGVVGETWLANIELIGALDEQGMVVDFGQVKKTIRAWLDTHIDHKLLVPTTSPQLSFEQKGNTDRLEWHCKTGNISTTGPSEAHTFIDVASINTKDVAQWCAAKLKRLFPDSVETLSLSFSVERIDDPYYHYTHGLKKHLGNCQRIAHGHRSRIEIWRDGEMALDLMQDWAEKWQDIYLGTEEDCKPDPENTSNYLFSYDAQQGRFELSIPKTQCYLLQTETTVELIAGHIATTLANANCGSHFKVKAFEGIAKGAIAESSSA